MRVHAGLFIALLAAALIWWLLERSTLGFRLRAVGANQFAARTAGMSVEHSYIIGDAARRCARRPRRRQPDPRHQPAGHRATSTPASASTRSPSPCSAGPIPVGIVLAGLLFGALHAGGTQMQSATGTPIDLVAVIQSLIVLFIAAPAADPGDLPAQELGRAASAPSWRRGGTDEHRGGPRERRRRARGRRRRPAGGNACSAGSSWCCWAWSTICSSRSVSRRGTRRT